MNIVNAGYKEIPMGLPTPENVMKHIERCGRICYKSEDRITQGSAEKFCASLIQRGHTSVLEHANLIFRMNHIAYCWWMHRLNLMSENGFKHFLRNSHAYNGPHFDSFIISGNVRAWRDVIQYINQHYHCGWPSDIVKNFTAYGVLFSDLLSEQNIVNDESYQYADSMTIVDPDHLPENEKLIHGTKTICFICDRGISHELVRHRTASFSQESTRYCNYSMGQFGGEITVVKPLFFDESGPVYRIWKKNCTLSETMYFDLLDEGCSPQEARSVLPNSLKTEVVMTDTYAHWHHFLELRTPKAAHPQMREIAIPLLKDFQKESSFFGDISVPTSTL